MPKVPRQIERSVASGKRRKVDEAFEIHCPCRVYADQHGPDYPEDYCKKGQTFKGIEKLKFVSSQA